MGNLTVFNVTSMGLQIDNRMIMPGSRLLIKGAPHTAWNGCGHIAGQSSEQSLQVASPAVAGVPAEPEPGAYTLEEARELYEEILGKKPHHKARAETLLTEIQAYSDGE